MLFPVVVFGCAAFYDCGQSEQCVDCSACYDYGYGRGEYDGGADGGWYGDSDGSKDGNTCEIYDDSCYSNMSSTYCPDDMGSYSCCGIFIEGYNNGYNDSYCSAYQSLSGYEGGYSSTYGSNCCGDGEVDDGRPYSSYVEECDEGANNGDCIILPPATSCNYCDATSCTWEIKTLSCNDFCTQKTYFNTFWNEERNYLQGTCSAANPGARESSPKVAVSNPPPKESSVIGKLLGFVGNIFNKKDEVRQLDKTPELKIGDCSEYYKQGSIELKDLSSSVNVIKAGETITFKVKAKNSNSYPVADSSLYIKVYRQKENKTPAQIDYLVDDFFAAEGVSLWPGEEKELTFEWKAPKKALGGNYSVNLFFTGSKHFNLSGHSFIPQVPATGRGFQVEGGTEGIWLDNDNIKINEYDVNLSTFFPVLPEGPVSISIPLITNLKEGKASVLFDLHPFDITSENFELFSYRQRREVSLSSPQQQLEFVLEDLKPGAYVAKVSVLGPAQKSIADIRFSISGSSARYIITGLTSFPLGKNQESTIFACFANSADTYTNALGRAEVQLVKADTGTPIAAMEYAGDIYGKEVQIEKTFSPKEREDVVLVARLFDEKGNLVDQVRTGYVLERFTQREGVIDFARIVKVVSLIILLILVLIAILFIFRKFRTKKQIVTLPVLFLLIALSLFGLSLKNTVSADSVKLTVPYAPVNFKCLGSDQPCCKYWYDLWGSQGFSYPDQWREIQADHQMSLSFNYSIWRESNPGTSLSTDPVAPANLSRGDKLEDYSDTVGDFLQTGGFIHSPPVNWLEDTGISGNGVYYSDPHFTTATDGTARRCSAYQNIDDNLCPPGGNHDGVEDQISPNIFVGNNDLWNAWCNNAYNYPYDDANFNLPTYVMAYGIGVAPNTWYYKGAACIGTQINCDRTMTITVTGNLVCTLTNRNPNNNPPGNPDSCTTQGTGSCSLKASKIDSECIPTGTGAASVRVSHDFDCFAYFDRGVFVETEDTEVPFWQAFAFDCQGQQCWCQGTKQQREIINQQCAGLYYPMKLTTVLDKSSLTKTYYFNIVDSKAEVTTYKVGSAAAENYMGKAEIPAVSLPADVQFTCQYSDMYPGTEGAPFLEGIQCGDAGTLVGGSASCTNPGGNNQGTCTFKCNYPVQSVGTVFQARAKIKNTAKITECVGDVEIINGTIPNDPPTVLNLQASVGDPCYEDVIIRFSWNFSDPNGDSQSSYILQIDKDQSFTQPDLIELTGGSETTRDYLGVEWNTRYYWRLEVIDEHGASSGWISGGSFITPSVYPSPDFSWVPVHPDPTNPVALVNQTDCPASSSPCSYTWTFEDATLIDPSTIHDENPNISFNSNGNKKVTLSAMDTLGRTCEKEKNVCVGSCYIAPPKWQEIPPFSWINEFLSAISNFIKF